MESSDPGWHHFGGEEYDDGLNEASGTLSEDVFRKPGKLLRLGLMTF